MSADRRDDGAAWPFVGTVALAGIFVLLLLFTLYLARPFLLPLVLATILNFLLSPVVRVLARLHVPQPLGAGLVILALLGIVALGIERLRPGRGVDPEGARGRGAGRAAYPRASRAGGAGSGGGPGGRGGGGTAKR